MRHYRIRYSFARMPAPITPIDERLYRSFAGEVAIEWAQVYAPGPEEAFRWAEERRNIINAPDWLFDAWRNKWIDVNYILDDTGYRWMRADDGKLYSRKEWSWGALKGL